MEEEKRYEVVNIYRNYEPSLSFTLALFGDSLLYLRVDRSQSELLSQGYIFIRDFVRIKSRTTDGVIVELAEEGEHSPLAHEQVSLLHADASQRLKLITDTRTHNFLPFLCDTLPYTISDIKTQKLICAAKNGIHPQAYHLDSGEELSLLRLPLPPSFIARICYKTRISMYPNTYNPFFFVIAHSGSVFVKIVFWREVLKKFSCLRVDDLIYVKNYKNKKKLPFIERVECNTFTESVYFDVPEITVRDLVKLEEENGMESEQRQQEENGEECAVPSPSKEADGSERATGRYHKRRQDDEKTGKTAGGHPRPFKGTRSDSSDGSLARKDDLPPESFAASFVTISGTVRYRSVLLRYNSSSGLMEYFLCRIDGHQHPVVLFYNSDENFYRIDAGSRIAIHELRRIERAKTILYVSTIYTQFELLSETEDGAKRLKEDEKEQCMAQERGVFGAVGYMPDTFSSMGEMVAIATIEALREKEVSVNVFMRPVGASVDEILRARLYINELRKYVVTGTPTEVSSDGAVVDYFEDGILRAQKATKVVFQEGLVCQLFDNFFASSQAKPVVDAAEVAGMVGKRCVVTLDAFRASVDLVLYTITGIRQEDSCFFSPRRAE